MIYDSVFKTLNYFNLFDFPLTAEELFSNLWEPPQVSYESFLIELAELKKQGKIAEKFSYYFLPGFEEVMEKRRKAIPLVEKKLRNARRAAKLISNVPFLKAIFVCNSIAAEAVDEDSDIDFFIITETNRAWMVRFFTNLILFVFGLRRHGAKVADRVCLSFYVDKANLNLEPLLLQGKDIYFAYWLKQLLPIYDPENYHQKILENNLWQKKYLRTAEVLPGARITNGSVGKNWKKIWEAFWKGWYGDLLEKQFQKIQMDKIKISGKNKIRSADSAVVTTDGVLKFHEKDTRVDLRDRWIKNCEKTYAAKNN